MAKAKTETEKNQEKAESFKPARLFKGTKTNFYPKNAIFTKEKTFIDDKIEKKSIVGWRKFALKSSKTVVLYKGEALFESELKLFDEKSKKKYLEERK